MKDRLWAIILAGGEGTRLAETTRRMYGSSLPKQFLGFGQSRTFLQATIDRMGALIPAERMVVVVPARYEELAREQVRGFDGIEVVSQPSNRGTLPGVLLPLVHVLKRDCRANVALVPSDHDFRTPDVMLDAIERARGSASSSRAGMVLLGAKADAPASDLGWIVTKELRRYAAVRPIERFIEKPAPLLADQLFRAGALWNTMLSVSRGDALWRLAQRHSATSTALFERYASALGTVHASAVLHEVYQQLRASDFSRDLVTASRGLLATAMHDAGWSDCGTPERLEAVFGVNVVPNVAPALSRGIAAEMTG